MLSAFSMFFMQSQSFLEYQRQLQSRSGKDNVQSIFGVEKIPCDQQIRNILDLISTNSMNVVFERIYQFLQNGKHLQRYSSPKSFMRKIGLRLRSASVYGWLSEVEASHNSFRIAIYLNG
jgi:hypothetical protein